MVGQIYTASCQVLKGFRLMFTPKKKINTPQGPAITGGGKKRVYIDQVKENKIQYLIKLKIGKDGMRGNNIAKSY